MFSTLPQAGAYMSYEPSLLHMLSTREPLRYLVNMSASWSPELTKSVMISPESTFSLTKWQSISICLVRSWKIGFDEIWRATWLSHNSLVSWVSPNFSCWRSCLSHVISNATAAIARYSALALNLATVFCFLLLQEIKFSLMRTQVDLLSDGDPAQSASK